MGHRALLATDSTGSKRLAMAMQTPSPSPVSSTEEAAAVDKVDSAKSRPEAAEMSAAEEESVLLFAKQEEPQLFELLKFLKKKRPSAYQQALRETGRTQQKLENLRQRDPELYQIESQLWKTRSKLSLVAAQLSVKQNDDLEKQLETLVRDLDSQEVARIKMMRDRSAKQLEKWDTQLKDRTVDSDASVEKSLESWKNRIKKQTSNRKKP